MLGIELHLQVSQEIGLLGEELATDGTVVHRQLLRFGGGSAGMGHHVLPVNGLLAVDPLTDGASEESISLTDLNEVRQWSTAREHAPVVRVVLVNVFKEAYLIQTLLLAHLTGKVMWVCHAGVNLKHASKQKAKNITTEAYYQCLV